MATTCRRIRQSLLPAFALALAEFLVVHGILAPGRSCGGVEVRNASLIDHVASAIHRYHEDTGSYPALEQHAGDGNELPAVYEALMGQRPPLGRGGPRAPYLDRVREDRIVVLDAGAPGGLRPATPEERLDPDVPKHILDLYGTLLWYRLNAGREPAAAMRNAATFDLWSLGPDRRNQTLFDEKDSDDIGNW